MAQQLPQYSQYTLNEYAINPAYAGSNPYWEVKSNHRYQWVGIQDAPRTYTISLMGPNKKGNMGFGSYIFTDIVGPTRRTGIQLSYAYHVKLNSTFRLGMALSAGMLEYQLDGSKITLKDPSDNVITNGLQSTLVVDGKFGVYLYSDEFYFGASLPQIMQNKVFFFDNQNSKLSKLEDHYFVQTGYKYKIDEDFSVEPSILMKYVKPTPIQFDFTIRGFYKEMVWLGGTYRTNGAFSIMTGYAHKHSLLIGYSYDISTSSIRNYNSGSHELVLAIRFIDPNKKKWSDVQSIDTEE